MFESGNICDLGLLQNARTHGPRGTVKTIEKPILHMTQVHYFCSGNSNEDGETIIGDRPTYMLLGKKLGFSWRKCVWTSCDEHVCLNIFWMRHLEKPKTWTYPKYWKPWSPVQVCKVEPGVTTDTCANACLSKAGRSLHKMITLELKERQKLCARNILDSLFKK